MTTAEPHVRHETKTREHYKLVGDGKPLPPRLSVTWCSRVELAPTWFFESTDHVLLALQQGTGISPCRDCLREIQGVLRAELGPPTLPSAVVTESGRPLLSRQLVERAVMCAVDAALGEVARQVGDLQPTLAEARSMGLGAASALLPGVPLDPADVEAAGAFEHLAECELDDKEHP
jgi:hypothetical protein